MFSMFQKLEKPSFLKIVCSSVGLLVLTAVVSVFVFGLDFLYNFMYSQFLQVF